MKEFFPTKPQKEVTDNNNQTTLVIDEIPSELAYGILVEALNQGDTLTHEELVAEIEARTEGEGTVIHFTEIESGMIEFINDAFKNYSDEEKSFNLQREDDNELYYNYVQRKIENYKAILEMLNKDREVNPTPTPSPIHR